MSDEQGTVNEGDVNPPPPPPEPKEGEHAVTTTTTTSPSAGEQTALDALIATARQLPGLVPGLVRGSTPGEIEASITEARAAYATIKADIDKAAQEGIPATGGSAGAEPPVTPGYGRILRAVENEAKRK